MISGKGGRRMVVGAGCLVVDGADHENGEIRKASRSELALAGPGLCSKVIGAPLGRLGLPECE